MRLRLALLDMLWVLRERLLRREGLLWNWLLGLLNMLGLLLLDKLLLVA